MSARRSLTRDYCPQKPALTIEKFDFYPQVPALGYHYRLVTMCRHSRSIELMIATTTTTSEVFDLKPTSERFRDFVESRLCRASQNC
jgi:hypothetical protein